MPGVEKTSMPKLSVPERKKVIAVMTDLFTTIDDLTAFIRDNTGRNVQEIVVGALPITRSRLLDNAEGRGWLGELIEALKDIAPDDARATLDSIQIRSAVAQTQADKLRVAVRHSIPDDELLRILRERLGTAVVAGHLESTLADAQMLAVAKAMRGEATNAELRRSLEDLGLLAPTPMGLEKLVTSGKFFDLDVLARRLTEIEGYVCRIAVDSVSGLKARGTGFLIGPSTVLTNHHVIAAMLKGDLEPKRLRAQFDFRVLKDGSTDAGTILELDHAMPTSWCLASAPHDPKDTKVHPLEDEPQPENLDYAILRLAQPAGAQPIGPVAGDPEKLPKRGWIDLTKHGDKAAVDSAIFIAQHPSGLPVKLAFEPKGTIGYSPNDLRMRYAANTLAGSSGSPVFNDELEIIALHHAGDPTYPALDTGKYNEGIPIPALLKRLSGVVLAKIAA
jgi:hypothetical protein